VRWWPRRRWLAFTLIAVAVLVSLASVVVYRWKMPRVREQIVSILSRELGATVELGDVQVSLGGIVRVSGKDLVLHHKIHSEGPPLVRIDAFSIEAPIMAIMRQPVHISSVDLKGLHIFIPPREGAPDPDNATAPAAESGDDMDAAPVMSRLRGPSPVVIDRLTSSGAVLEVASRKPDRLPRAFLIHDLILTDAAFDRPVRYDAHLTNPIPAGTIDARGTFGPWNADEPTLTPLTGTYTFADADLGTINGSGGTLQSTGRFFGRLERINVTGTTTTPNFTLEIGGEAVPLDTTFTAIVDGTNGDTILNPVHATLGRTHLTAAGGIVHTPGRKGRTVSLTVSIEHGRLEDVLRLAIDAEPPAISGALTLQTRFELPPGSQEVPERLYLKGQFRVASARFSSTKVQDKIDELSRRGRGRPGDKTVDNVASDLRGNFVLDNGRLTLTPVSFGVRGALIHLQGVYSLTHRRVDFAGTARLDARVSQMVTGWKRLPLKIFDPIFARDGAGTVLPIRIVGPVRKPEFKVEVRKIF
jgi:uncharacterized protein involved in outer membrane biogenesis